MRQGASVEAFVLSLPPLTEDLTSLGIGEIQNGNTTGAPLSNFSSQQEKKSHLVAMLQPLGGKA